MNVKFLWVVIILLTLLVLGEAGYIYQRRPGAEQISTLPELSQVVGHGKTPEAGWEELDAWRGKAYERLDSGVQCRPRTVTVSSAGVLAAGSFARSPKWNSYTGR